MLAHNKTIQGFTLIELILLLLIIGGLTMLLAPYHADSEQQARQDFEHIVQTLRHAQQVSRVSHCRISVRLTPHTVTLAYDDPICGTAPLPLPAGQSALFLNSETPIVGENWHYERTGQPSITQTLLIGRYTVSIAPEQVL